MKDMLDSIEIGDILEVQNGFAFKSKFFNSDGEGVPLIRIRDLERGQTETFYSGKYRDEFLVEPGDYLVGMDGDFRCVIWNGPRGLLNQRVCRLHKFADGILPDFVFHAIGRRLDEIHARTAFVTVKHISSKQIKAIKIPFPSLEEQRRIVDILNRAASIRRLRDQANATLRALIPALFIKMFGDPAENPMGWEVRPLGELVRFQSGGTPSKSERGYWNGDVPWVSPKDMKPPVVRSSIDHITERALEETPIKIVPPGAVLVVVRGMILAHTVPVRRIDQPVTINQDMKALIPSAMIISEYLRWHLEAQQHNILGSVATAAHGTKRIELSTLTQLPIMVPPKALQVHFDGLATACSAISALGDRAAGSAALMSNSLTARLLECPARTGDGARVIEASENS